VVKNWEGPTALFTSGNHGDEYECQVALTNLAKSLDPARIKGRVIILTMANYVESEAPRAGMAAAPALGGGGPAGGAPGALPGLPGAHLLAVLHAG
jgi:hypothetical protein